LKLIFLLKQFIICYNVSASKTGISFLWHFMLTYVFFPSLCCQIANPKLCCLRVMMNIHHLSFFVNRKFYFFSFFQKKLFSSDEFFFSFKKNKLSAKA